jgi:CheY-like chemotaxis protein
MAKKSPKKVLVVEDDEDLVLLISMLLSSDGYRVETAGNGREALERIERELPDLILLDMKMPVMSGPEFAREFKARYDTRAPIVVVTAAADARQRAAEVAADGWVGKPFDPDALLATVRRHLDAAESRPARTSAQ